MNVLFGSGDGANPLVIMFLIAIMARGVAKAWKKFDQNGAVHQTIHTGAVSKVKKWFGM